MGLHQSGHKTRHLRTPIFDNSRFGHEEKRDGLLRAVLHQVCWKAQQHRFLFFLLGYRFRFRASFPKNPKCSPRCWPTNTIVRSRAAEAIRQTSGKRCQRIRFTLSLRPENWHQRSTFLFQVSAAQPCNPVTNRKVQLHSMIAVQRADKVVYLSKQKCGKMQNSETMAVACSSRDCGSFSPSNEICPNLSSLALSSSCEKTQRVVGSAKR